MAEIAAHLTGIRPSAREKTGRAARSILGPGKASADPSTASTPDDIDQASGKGLLHKAPAFWRGKEVDDVRLACSPQPLAGGRRTAQDHAEPRICNRSFPRLAGPSTRFSCHPAAARHSRGHAISNYVRGALDLRRSSSRLRRARAFSASRTGSLAGVRAARDCAAADPCLPQFLPRPGAHAAGRSARHSRRRPMAWWPTSRRSRRPRCCIVA